MTENYPKKCYNCNREIKSILSLYAYFKQNIYDESDFLFHDRNGQSEDLNFCSKDCTHAFIFQER